MNTADMRSKTNQSKFLLDTARKLAEQAQALPEGDDKRNWLEQEASELIVEAENLTTQVQADVSKFNQSI